MGLYSLLARTKVGIRGLWLVFPAIYLQLGAIGFKKLWRITRFKMVIMSLNQNDVKKIAKLARIRVTTEEITHYTEELNGIFNWIEQLREVNTEGIAEMAGVGQRTLRLREDKVTDGGIKEDVLRNAPEAAYDCFLVPKVIE